MPAFVIKRPNASRVAAIKKQNTLNIIAAIKNQHALRVDTAMKNMQILRAAKIVCRKENNAIKCDYVPATFKSEEPGIVLSKIN
jgi:hypothetical protein